MLNILALKVKIINKFFIKIIIYKYVDEVIVGVPVKITDKMIK